MSLTGSEDAVAMGFGGSLCLGFAAELHRLECLEGPWKGPGRALRTVC